MSEKKLNFLQKLFKLGFKPKAKDVKDKVFPLRWNNIKGVLEKEKLPSFVRTFLDYWMRGCHDSEESWKERHKLFEDMDLLYYNSPVHSRAINLIADEVVQADSNTQPINVEAPKKQKDFILDFYDKIGLYAKLRPIAINLCQYGNAGGIIAMDDSGVEDLILVSPYDIKDRLEFTPYEVAEKINNNDNFLSRYRSKVDRIDMLIQAIQDKENYTSYFKSYLFGYQIADRVLPPWRFLHFRNLTDKSPFKPFGMPLYIHAMAIYRQYDMAMTLQAAKRAAQIPIDHYKVVVPPEGGAGPTEKLQYVIDFFKSLFNTGLRTSKKEGTGIGEIAISIDGLYEYESISPDIDLGKIEDIDLLRKDLFDSSWLPRYMVDPEDSGFGESGVALIQRWKPFARLVFHIQNAILNEIDLLTKIHMIQSGKFTPDEIDYVLSMPYPESQVNREIIDSQSDLLSLANEIIDSLSDKLMDGEPLPDEVVKDIYAQFLPYDDKRIDDWYKNIKKDDDRPEEEKAKIEENWREVKKAFKNTRLKEEIDKVIFDRRQDRLREGKINNKHYFSSRNINNSFNPHILHDFRVKKLKNLKQKGTLKEEKISWGEEEITYKLKRGKKRGKNSSKQ